MGLGDAQTFQAEARALGQGTVQSVEGMVNPRVGAGGWWESQCLWGRDATEKAQGIGWGQKEALWIPSDCSIVPWQSLQREHNPWGIAPMSLDPRVPGASAIRTQYIFVECYQKSLQAVGAREVV